MKQKNNIKNCYFLKQQKKYKRNTKNIKRKCKYD